MRDRNAETHHPIDILIWGILNHEEITKKIQGSITDPKDSSELIYLPYFLFFYVSV